MTIAQANGKAAAAGTILDTALAYLAAGYSVIPIRTDGSKAPEVAWTQYQQRPAIPNVLRHWFGKIATPGVAIIGGAVSGNLEVLDFDRDAQEIFPAWCALVESEAPGLIARLPIIRTPKAGCHAYYRCPNAEIPGNTKLAMDPAAPSRQRTLIESRGKGGYVLAPGCPPACHEAGRTYEHVSGPDLCHVPVVSPEERDVLLRCARSFNREGASAAVPQTAGELRPGDDFNQRGPAWADILTPHGWANAHEVNGKIHWRRPGKERGWSATTGYCKGKDGIDLFAVFTSNAAPFEGENGSKRCTCYTKFAAYTLLNHAGDYKASAKDLAAKGYGEQRPKRKSKGLVHGEVTAGEAGSAAGKAWTP
jgi:putative DNA primase/helicase